MVNYNFEWDPVKAKTNIKKHRVSFEEAVTIFADPNTMTIYDEEHSIKEERWVSLGIAYTEKLLVVCHIFQRVDSNNYLIRIFSARKATKNERKQYGGGK